MKIETIYFEGKEQGANQIGSPYRCETGGWYRDDTWQSRGVMSGSFRYVLERRRVTGPTDQSGLFRAAYAGDPGNGRYNSQCPCCYLGHSHSLDYHNQSSVWPDPFTP
jgi:hypothetical protein